MYGSHDTIYQPDAGRSFNADDLHRAELAKLDEALAVHLPQIAEEGVEVFIEHLKHEKRMAKLETKLRESLSPDLVRRAKDLFRERAEQSLKQQKEAATTTAPVVTPQAVVNAAVVNAEKNERRPQARR